MNLAGRVSEELLPHVERPGQYIGREFNQLVQSGDWERADVRVAIAFPDTYAIGMSHLGCQILYWIGNHMPGVCAERVFAPWIDAEQVMRRRSIPLFTWDTRQPVRDAHILAVSMQYELSFTNLLTMLDLAGIPLHASERGNDDPLVVVGGPQMDNPEPIADFVDLVVIGDGEESLPALVDLYRRMSREGAGRQDVLVEAARRFEWVYAPSLYSFDYRDDGTILRLRPSDACPADFVPPSRIGRCRVRDLETAPTPLRPLIPHTEIVHDRIAIEIMRGCPNRCRFCHAGYTKVPLCHRSVEQIEEIAEQAWAATGHDEIGLLSLSTADYPQLEALASRLNARFVDRHVSLSVPSLRVDRMLSDIPSMVGSVRKSGLTVAVEAAREDMRAAMRKKVLDVDLMDGLKQAYAAGWNSVKIYFMVGFPGETEDDIRGIFDLAREVSLAKRGVRGGPAAVTASVGWLVPRPHTPLQWAAQQTGEYFHAARRQLKDLQRNIRSAVKVKTHRIERSLLEGVLSRGDRRLGRVIETAWGFGVRMDGWDETFRYDLWQQAFEHVGLDPAFYAHRRRPFDEILPWDHIVSGASRAHLEHQYDDVFVQLGGRQAGT
ncbi:MAG TPA: TIGR03960 family B12-binding radical SAM protein [Phycisphaerae bacterium]|nr:TIGR03960 family B12-binding radical SAM protein [Phycisphaerae bacterium]